jgi:hypothetical protein
VLRRLHAPAEEADRRQRKEAYAPSRRILAKVTLAAPLSVMEAIVQQVGGG